MASADKQVQQLARQFLKLSFINGEISAEQVAGVLQYIETHRPLHSVAVLKAYGRLIATEVARTEARIEHAGPADPGKLGDIGSTMTKKYGRRIKPVARRNDDLLAGFRVRVGDDVYESSVAGQLAALGSSV